MCLKSVESAKDRIRQELLENEVVIWEGTPDRSTLYRRLKFFCYRNLAFAFLLLSGVAATVYINPAYSKSIIILLSGAGLLRAIGAMMVWPKMTRRWNLAYALTDRRLIKANGRSQELSSWFSPCIDRMRIKKNGKVATYKLGDSELGFNIELYAILNHDRLSSLLAPYQMSNIAVKETVAPAPQSDDQLMQEQAQARFAA